MPKIVLYTPDVKCSLMETGVDFEATFLCGVKMVIHRENFKADDPLKIKILNHQDKSESLLDYDRVTASNRSVMEHFSPEIRHMLDSTIMVECRCRSQPNLALPSSSTNSVSRGIKYSKIVKSNIHRFKRFPFNSARNTHKPMPIGQVSTPSTERAHTDRAFAASDAVLHRAYHFQSIWWFVVHGQ